MEHPLIGNIDDLSLDDLSAKVNDLTKKLNFAVGTGNGHLCNQLRMALITYQNKYQEKLRDSYKRRDGDPDFEDKIQIK